MIRTNIPSENIGASPPPPPLPSNKPQVETPTPSALASPVYMLVENVCMLLSYKVKQRLAPRNIAATLRCLPCCSPLRSTRRVVFFFFLFFFFILSIQAHDNGLDLEGRTHTHAATRSPGKGYSMVDSTGRLVLLQPCAHTRANFFRGVGLCTRECRGYRQKCFKPKARLSIKMISYSSAAAAAAVK